MANATKPKLSLYNAEGPLDGAGVGNAPRTASFVSLVVFIHVTLKPHSLPIHFPSVSPHFFGAYPTLTKSKKPVRRAIIWIALCLVALFVARKLAFAPEGEDASPAITAQDGGDANQVPITRSSDGSLAEIQAPEPSERRAGPAETTDVEPVPAKPEPKVVEHNLFGQVVLYDGTPLPRVGVRAKRLSGEGLDDEKALSTKANKGGDFFFGEVAPGTYAIEVVMNDTLPVRGSGEFVTSDLPKRVEVDALLLQVTSMDAAHQVVPMFGVQHSVLPDPITNAQGGRAHSTSFVEPRLEHSSIVLTTQRIHFSSNDEAKTGYYGVLEAGFPSGLHRLVLTEYPPQLGRLLLRASQPDLPDGAFIRVDSIEKDGASFNLMEPVVRAMDGKVELPLGGLLPGEYKLQLALQNAGPIGLHKEIYETKVDAGSERTIDLEAFTGGRIEIKATADSPAQGRVFAAAEYRRKGSQTWQPLWLTTRTQGNGFIIQSAVLVAGSPALSFPTLEGEYEIRLSLEAHRAETRYAKLLAGQTEKLEIHLVGE